MNLLAYFSLVFAALGYASLGIWRLVIGRGTPQSLHLVIAFGGMAFWAGSKLSTNIPLAGVGEAVRDLGWLTYIHAVMRPMTQDPQKRWWSLSPIGALFMVLILRIAVAAVILLGGARSEAAQSAVLLFLAGGWLFSILGLILVHNLYRRTAESAGSGFRLILLALGLMWAYDINFYTVKLLGYAGAIPYLSAGRGLVAVMLIPSFAFAARRKERWRITISRHAATQSLLFVSIGIYLVVISMATQAIVWVGNTGNVLKVAVAVAMTGLVSFLILSPRTRAQIKVLVIKHLFEHRYDYRTEWLRFSATIGDRQSAGLSDAELAIKSIADVTESRGGALLLTSQRGQLELAGTWHWDDHVAWPTALPVLPEWIRFLEETGRIITLETLRTGVGEPNESSVVPDWLIGTQQAWVAVPLVRSHRLIGMVVLGSPDLVRELDWEDFELLKVVGQQVAMHLADTQSRAELEEARRFEEFNRRFAFIIHDIKNVVSQLSLLSSNVPLHGANPKFQADMANTLANATSKMNNLLSRLSSDQSVSGTTLGQVKISGLLRRAADARSGQHPITVAIIRECEALADEEQLLLAIDHLIQNAIEASRQAFPITLSLDASEERAEIKIEDCGVGMSAEFIRNELFKPFVSTKGGGFGIGAAEAKALIASMGGTLDVTSVEGSGSSFSIRLPLLSLSRETKDRF